MNTRGLYSNGSTDDSMVPSRDRSLALTDGFIIDTMGLIWKLSSICCHSTLAIITDLSS